MTTQSSAEATVETELQPKTLDEELAILGEHHPALAEMLGKVKSFMDKFAPHS